VIVSRRGGKTRKRIHSDHSQLSQACEIGREDAACDRRDVVVEKISAERGVCGMRETERNNKKGKYLTHSSLRLVRPEKRPLGMTVIWFRLINLQRRARSSHMRGPFFAVLLTRTRRHTHMHTHSRSRLVRFEKPLAMNLI
jgi:hypothetical protein